MTNGTRREWGVSVTPRPLFTPRKDPVPIVQETGWAPGLVWTGAEYLASIGIQSPDRPALSQSLYWLSYPGPPQFLCWWPNRKISFHLWTKGIWLFKNGWYRPSRLFWLGFILTSLGLRAVEYFVSPKTKWHYSYWSPWKYIVFKNYSLSTC